MIRESRRGADGSTSPASESRAMWPAIWPPCCPPPGPPAYFLHGTEAVHGSCGQLVAGDVVICISNSGRTAELKATVIAVKNNGCKVIGVTGDPGSWLARTATSTSLPGWGRREGPQPGALQLHPGGAAHLAGPVRGAPGGLRTDAGRLCALSPRRKAGPTAGRRELKMLTGACIHPDLMRVLSLCGHGDKVLIADGNYPLASCSGGAEKVYLGLTPGLPTVTDVLAVPANRGLRGKAEVMDPEDGSTPEIFGVFRQMLGTWSFRAWGAMRFTTPAVSRGASGRLHGRGADLCQPAAHHRGGGRNTLTGPSPPEDGL